jgi:UDP-GlcNAc:undecaprenyl-phosphate/decaprenyl-phosphate GlcNAc-1-phosphate transferase
MISDSFLVSCPRMSHPFVPLLLLFVCSLVASYVVTEVVRRTSSHVGFVDVPNDRKRHRGATPRLGGLGIGFGFGFPLLMLAAHPLARAVIQTHLLYVFGLLAAGCLIVALGIYDDVHGANAPKKFVVQTLAAVILVVFGFRFDRVAIGNEIVSIGWFGAIASVIWIVGVINAMNFIDGIDSLATVVSLTIAATFIVIGFVRDDSISLIVMTALAGSLAGFYPWNKPPAKIFMGDTGSMFIGLLLAAVSIAHPAKSGTALIVGGPIVALALPVIDTLIVMKLRFSGHAQSLSARIARVFRADRRHIHHILVSRHGSTGKAIFWIWLVTLLFGLAAILTILEVTRIMGYLSGAVGFLLLLVLRYRGKVSVEVLEALDTTQPAREARRG